MGLSNVWLLRRSHVFDPRSKGILDYWRDMVPSPVKPTARLVHSREREAIVSDVALHCSLYNCYETITSISYFPGKACLA